jgi:hypothetical protein
MSQMKKRFPTAINGSTDLDVAWSGASVSKRKRRFQPWHKNRWWGYFYPDQQCLRWLQWFVYKVGSFQINNVTEEDRVFWNNDDTAILIGNDTDDTQTKFLQGISTLCRFHLTLGIYPHIYVKPGRKCTLSRGAPFYKPLFKIRGVPW